MFKNTSLLVVVVTVVIFAFTRNWLSFFETEYRTIENWAHFGTYIGGVLGVFFGGITLIMVIKTYHANQEVLRNMNVQLQQNEKQLNLYAEEMEAMKEEAKMSRDEAKKSAEALTNQAQHLFDRDAISYARDALKSYEEQINNLLAIEWQISELGFAEYDLIKDDINEFSERGVITYSRLIKIAQLKDVETVNKIIQGFDNLTNHRHYNDFKDELLLLLKRRSVNISLLISHGAPHSICELESNESFNLLNELKTVDFMTDREMGNIVSPVNEAASVRQQVDSNFGSIKNSYRNARLDPLKS